MLARQSAAPGAVVQSRWLHPITTTARQRAIGSGALVDVHLAPARPPAGAGGVQVLVDLRRPGRPRLVPADQLAQHHLTTTTARAARGGRRRPAA